MESIFYIGQRKSTGQSQNRCVTGVQNGLVNKKRAEQGTSLLSSKVVSMGVFCDDFAAVDVREGLCYHSRPKKQIQEVHGTGIKPMKESIARRKKRQPIPRRVSGDGSAPPRFRFGFPCCSCLLFRGVCLAAASEASRTCLCQAHATVPNCFFVVPIVKNYFL